MEKKYKLREDLTKEFYGKTLYRIEALRDFGIIKKGELGGYIGKEENLSHGDAVVCGNAQVYGDAKVCGKAVVWDNAQVCGNAVVCGDAVVCGTAQVYGDAKVYGDAVICGDAVITKTSDYYVGKNTWSSGRYFTYTRSNRMWKVGCFYGTGEELIEKAYKDSEVSGREYKRIVEYVEAMYNDLENGK